jgi:hypothetical protein
VDFIAGAVEETGIDENHPVRSGTDRGLQVATPAVVRRVNEITGLQWRTSVRAAIDA